MSPTALRYVDSVEIMDIHQENMEFSLVDDIYKSIDPPSGEQRTFPTLLLYDAKGLKLFEKITYLEEYYPTNTQIEVLETHAKRIVERLPENAQLVELGSGYVTLTPRSPTTYISSQNLTFMIETYGKSRSYFENASEPRRKWITMLWTFLWWNCSGHFLKSPLKASNM